MKTIWLNICLALIVAINSLTQLNVPGEYIAFGVAFLNMIVRFFGLKSSKLLLQVAEDPPPRQIITENLPPDIADAIMALITAILKQLFNGDGNKIAKRQFTEMEKRGIL